MLSMLRWTYAIATGEVFNSWRTNVALYKSQVYSKKFNSKTLIFRRLTPIIGDNWTINKLVYYWTHTYPQEIVLHELGLSSKTCRLLQLLPRSMHSGSWVAQWADWWTGEGIVEIDESKFGKRKYNRGKSWGVWVFGVWKAIHHLSNVSSPLFTNDQGSINTHSPRWILPASAIYSDCWKAYSTLLTVSYIQYRQSVFENTYFSFFFRFQKNMTFLRFFEMTLKKT